MARRIVRDDDLALDILQESWVKILEAVHAYRGESPACAWVRATVAHSAIDAHRKRARAREEDIGPYDRLADPGQSPEALLLERELVEMLAAMIAVLPETYRQVLTLRCEQELSTKETAELLEISRDNVAVRLNRASKMLRSRLEARLRAKAAKRPVGKVQPKTGKQVAD